VDDVTIQVGTELSGLWIRDPDDRLARRGRNEHLDVLVKLGFVRRKHDDRVRRARLSTARDDAYFVRTVEFLGASRDRRLELGETERAGEESVAGA